MSAGPITTFCVRKNQKVFLSRFQFHHAPNARSTNGIEFTARTQKESGPKGPNPRVRVYCCPT